MSLQKLYLVNFSIIITTVVFIISLFYFYPNASSSLLNTLTNNSSSYQVIPSPTPIPTITPTPTPTPIPVSISIPKLDINTEIVAVGNIENTNQMDIPESGDTVGWYKNMASPGASGSAILTGHYDLPGGAPAIFYPIKNITIGDQIELINNYNQKMIFEVSEIINQDIENFPSDTIYNQNTPAQIALITCSGYWIPSKQIYSSRLAVIAKLKSSHVLSSFELIAAEIPSEPENYLSIPEESSFLKSKPDLSTPYLRLSQDKNQISLFLATGNININAVDTEIYFNPDLISIINDSVNFSPIFKVHHQINTPNSIRISMYNLANINTKDQEYKIAEFSINRNNNDPLTLDLINPQIIKLELGQNFNQGKNILVQSQGITLN